MLVKLVKKVVGTTKLVQCKNAKLENKWHNANKKTSQNHVVNNNTSIKYIKESYTDPSSYLVINIVRKIPWKTTFVVLDMSGSQFLSQIIIFPGYIFPINDHMQNTNFTPV